MRRIALAAAIAIAGMTACTKADKSPVDSALSVGGPTVPFDSLSAVERNQAPALVAPAPATSRRSTSGTTTRRSTSSSGSSRTSGSSGTTTTASSGTTIKKNTKRDAAIGAAAGAVIGATTSGVKGAVVGGVVGGVIGGVIGNNVDVKKKKK